MDKAEKKPPIDMNANRCSNCKYEKPPHFECTHPDYRWYLENHEAYGRMCPLFKKKEKINETYI